MVNSSIARKIMASTTRVCESSGCQKEAKLQCPTCLKLRIEGSFFCNQECFKASWKDHKKIHKEERVKQNLIIQNEAIRYNPWPGYVFTGKLRPYPLSEKRTIPDSIMKPDYADHPEGYPESEMALRGSTQIKVLDEKEIADLREACRLGREVLDIAASMIKPGITTDAIDEAVHQACIERNCYPSPLNYRTFPKSCCTSVNEVICHGIPDKRPLEEGDICNVDITVFYNGYHGDLNETFFVGKVDEQSKELVRVTHEALEEAIKMIRPGVRYRDVGEVIQKHVQAHKFSVVRTYCGHGIHRLFHTSPSIPHYSKSKAIGVMKKGHAFTIEPMINAGQWRDKLWEDDWTAVTIDGQRSAQFEHTLIVTDTGCEVLTARREKNGRPHFMDQLEVMEGK